MHWRTLGIWILAILSKFGHIHIYITHYYIIAYVIKWNIYYTLLNIYIHIIFRKNHTFSNQFHNNQHSYNKRLPALLLKSQNILYNTESRDRIKTSSHFHEFASLLIVWKYLERIEQGTTALIPVSRRKAKASFHTRFHRCRITTPSLCWRRSSERKWRVRNSRGWNAIGVGATCAHENKRRQISLAAWATS